MNEWILIMLFFSGYGGDMSSMTTGTVRFKSKSSCEKAIAVLTLHGRKRNRESNGLINSLFVCVEDKK